MKAATATNVCNSICLPKYSFAFGTILLLLLFMLNIVFESIRALSNERSAVFYVGVCDDFMVCTAFKSNKTIFTKSNFKLSDYDHKFCYPPGAHEWMTQSTDHEPMHP